MGMSDKHRAANRARWAKVPQEKRRLIMKRVAKSKWANMSPEEARRHVDAMTQGRILKARKTK
jgi:predicted Fe-S protein YdhL (DUF1289 family)